MAQTADYQYEEEKALSFENDAFDLDPDFDDFATSNNKKVHQHLPRNRPEGLRRIEQYMEEQSLKQLIYDELEGDWE
ncbi:MAG: hypothetical protein OEZ58_18810 [Gammaproteobacteria bacterium]|nr:hypothetical protein [Gammaproteobacteria bacterium]MDH5731042.1 hypothetical protein [Gammaproteobacteria bacterium]